MYQHSKLYSIISYITWVGWAVALLLRDKEDPLVRRHLNQALVLNIVEILAGYITRRGGVIGTVGDVLDIACFVLVIMGIVRAAKLSEEPLPLIGGLDLIK